MQHKKTKMLVVDKAHKHDEYGVILIADIAAKVIAKGRALDRVNAYEIMTKPIISVHSEMDIRYCASIDLKGDSFLTIKVKFSCFGNSF
jgi:signal-transduction protein with cAMP-binding, CBS, and nucleotidyltransferase domain